MTLHKLQQRAKIKQLFVAQRDRLEAYLRVRLANPDEAAELAQEAYLRLLRVKRVDLIRHPQAYLYRIARNLVHEQYQSRRSHGEVDIDLDLLASEDPSPYELAVLARRRELLAMAVSELAPKCRAAMILRWREGLTQVEIGKRMGLSRQMVQKYLVAGLAHCRKRLRDTGGRERGEP